MALAAATIISVSFFTGLPLPGALRRYPVHDLQRVADRINADAHSGSNRRCFPSEDFAHVDYWRSRIVIDGVYTSTPYVPSPLPPSEEAMIAGADGRVFVSGGCD
jgi:hypothetical protein